MSRRSGRRGGSHLRHGSRGFRFGGPLALGISLTFGVGSRLATAAEKPLRKDPCAERVTLSSIAIRETRIAAVLPDSESRRTERAVLWALDNRRTLAGAELREVGADGRLTSSGLDLLPRGVGYCGDTPAFLGLPGDRLAAAWSCRGRSAAVPQVLLEVYEEGGRGATTVSPAAPTTMAQLAPQLLPASPEGLFVLWLENDGASGNFTLFARRLDRGGKPIEAPWPVTPRLAVAGDDGYRAVALPDGNWVVAWAGYGPDHNEETAVFLQRYDVSARSLDPARRVAEASRERQYAPDLAVSGHGDLAVLWKRTVRSGDPPQVRARVFTSSGEPLSQEVSPGNGEGSESFPSATASGDRFLALWLAGSEGGPLSRLMARWFSRSGAFLGEAEEIAARPALQNPPFRQLMPAQAGVSVYWLGEDPAAPDQLAFQRCLLARP
jgi:hypothetical protein